MLYNLHLLRVIAALGVVYFHTTSDAGLKLDWDVGSRGVDVFFVISGFIIAYIGTTKPEQFFRRRLIRVVPFYWAATLFVFTMVLLAPQFFRSTSADLTHLVTSLLFIPHESVTGEMHPTLLLGWSLNFEMFFYVLFAIALRLSPRRAPVLCVAALVGYVVVIHASGSEGPIRSFYARPIVLEFCYGIAAYYVFRWAADRRDALARIAGLKWLLGLVMIGSLIALVVFEQYYRDQVPRYLLAGVPSFFLVTSALLLERLYGLTTKNRLVYLLGEASYIIYLVHPYIIFSVLRVLVKNADAQPAPVLVLLIFGLLALTSVISIAIHLLFEKPVMAYLRAKLT
jgi:exopolysaccharide production protein ExoZ